VFDGIGAISRGRQQRAARRPSRTEAQRDPGLALQAGYGAAVQILKVEFGGDTNSTSDAEPSHEHTRGAGCSHIDVGRIHRAGQDSVAIDGRDSALHIG
jgi:hypothetical protein